MIDAVLLDVGGTLWPNDWPLGVGDDDERLARLLALSPHVDVAQARRLAVLLDRRQDLPNGGEQHADAAVRLVADELGLAAAFSDPAAVRRAICLPAHGHLHMLDGAALLLRQLRDGGKRAVLVSNTKWRDGEAYLNDFRAFGLGDCLAGAITSIDVGYRKPHAAVFEAAVELAGTPVTRCAMVGDSEECDVRPARRMGMSAVRVALEQPMPDYSEADLCTDSFGDVARFLLA